MEQVLTEPPRGDLLPQVTGGRGHDAHVHLHGRQSLERVLDAGVTTALDMACAPSLMDSLREIAGLTEIRSAGVPAIAPGSLHSRIPVVGQLGLVASADHAEKFVAEHPIELIDGPRLVELVREAVGPGADREPEPAWF